MGIINIPFIYSSNLDNTQSREKNRGCKRGKGRDMTV